MVFFEIQFSTDTSIKRVLTVSLSLEMYWYSFKIVSGIYIKISAWSPLVKYYHPVVILVYYILL